MSRSTTRHRLTHTERRSTGNTGSSSCGPSSSGGSCRLERLPEQDQSLHGSERSQDQQRRAHRQRFTPPHRNRRQPEREFPPTLAFLPLEGGRVRVVESGKPPRPERNSKQDGGPPGRATDR